MYNLKRTSSQGDAHAGERPAADRGTGSPHRSCDFGAPLLRADWPAVTRRACRPAKALLALERRARRADSPLPGRRVHARRDRSAARRLEPGRPGLGTPAERKITELDARIADAQRAKKLSTH